MTHATFRSSRPVPRSSRASSRAVRSQDDTRTGAVILAIVSPLAAILVLLGLIYATGTNARSAAAIAAAGCEPGTGSEAAPCTTPAMLARQYDAILNPATRQMTLDAAAYTASETAHLAAAQAALTAEVATMQSFNASLAAIKFPAATAIPAAAGALLRTDKALAALTAQQAGAATLAKMRAYNHRIQVDTAAVRAAMNLLVKAIDTPVKAG
jgi:hypothetical protein